MAHHSDQHDVRFPPLPASGLLLAAQRTESTFEEIPVIDFKDATSRDPRVRRELANLIRDACINVGFFYIKNHGIPQELIESTVEAGKDFFALSEAEKMKLDIHKSPNFKGYTPLFGENTDASGLGDLHEGFDLGWEPKPLPSEQGDFSQSTMVTVRDDGVMTGGNVWPDSNTLPGFKEAVLAYYHSALKLGQLLFPLFALALDLPEAFFDDKTTKPAAIMRLLHYPPQSPTKLKPQDDRQIGIGSHTDYEASAWVAFLLLPFSSENWNLLTSDSQCFTILWQDSAGGLQVQNASGKWIDAVPIPGTVVLNIGDQFARWTIRNNPYISLDDVFKSTVHRVINRSGLERYSIPLFFGSDYDVLLEIATHQMGESVLVMLRTVWNPQPVPTCVSPETPAKYQAITAGEYVKSRLEVTYAHSTS
ncbi:hypothetical protein D9756_004969 [Leucocoprinus leucothites]|uniref:Fe2OG dioxygenase domain-containing protein n=1 Tax=Leucocoprinus leucothites TaxID=201217 RepID=A0A8H5LKU3_9AGAR|nr:hypothetical protein D9756_004969 [Leucoagaricus leucothites]